MYFEVIFLVKYAGGEPYEMSIYVDDKDTKLQAITAAKQQMKHNFADAESIKYLSCEQKEHK